MAARKNKIRHDENTRLKIKTSQLVNRLTDHVFGKVELTPTQVRGIEILLKKTLPDLSQTEASHTINRQPDDLSDAELAAIAAGRSASPPEEADSAYESDSLH